MATVHTKTEELDSELGRILREGLGAPDARQLLDSPQVLVSAAAAALAAFREISEKPTRRLPAGDGDRRSLSPAEARRVLKAHRMVGDWHELWPDDELLTTDEAAARIGVSRPTVIDRIQRNQIVGLKREARGYRVPAEQFDSAGAPLQGISEVLDLIPTHNAAWMFLTAPFPFDEGERRPIDVLRAGDPDNVVSAARGWGTDHL